MGWGIDQLEASTKADEKASVPVAQTIASHIRYLARGKPFSVQHFTKFGSRSAVDKALARLVRAGALERVARGVYIRPKCSPYVGKVRPGPVKVMMAMAKARGEIIQVHGAEAVRWFRLSTQVQVRPMYYTSGSSRDLRVGDAVVHLRHVSADKLQCAGSQAGLALCALFYIGRRELTGAIVQTILSRLDTGEAERLMRCRMPRWMRKIVDGAYGQSTPASARGKG
ncbi:DUF6088 family protein [Pseudomonas mosselii]|uniref:DUF6088 family protein n=1 Tax=Pseudomonas mosselii TaxID=78327 RepID=UPI001EE268C9|nr:DUF6088 family protein [Pseudomonas mosselii]